MMETPATSEALTNVRRSTAAAIAFSIGSRSVESHQTGLFVDRMNNVRAPYFFST
jgi:hypothetical protein